MAEKIIKNTPFLQFYEETGKYSLVQEQITFVESKKRVREFEETKVLISDVWEDLKNTNGEWKWNNKKYFYWEFEVTSLEGETVKVQIEAPQPTINVFCNEEGNVDLEILDSDSNWSKYWKNIFNTVEENFEEISKISDDKIEGLKTNLVDYTPGNESFPEFDPNCSKVDDRDLINNLQTILF